VAAVNSQLVILVGTIARPKARYTPNGVLVFSFSLPTHSFYGKGEDRELRTTWFRVTVFGKRAEICQERLSDGGTVQVVGYLQGDEHGNPRTWQDDNGNVRSSFDVVARDVTILGKRGSKKGEEKKQQGEGDWIPF